MSLELSFPIAPDGHGVFDGRELARYLIASAYRALVPYVDGCPACTDNLFSVLANGVIEDLQKNGLTDCNLMTTLDPDLPTRAEAEAAHLKATEETTRAMLEGIEQHHH